MSKPAATNLVWRKCGKCDGTGMIRAFEHVAGGVCFECKGYGGWQTTVAKEARRKAAAKRRDLQRQAKQDTFVRGRMRTFKEAGQTFAEYHDASCACGDAAACGVKFGTLDEFNQA